MSILKAEDIEVGIRGQRITVRGSKPPEGDSRYGSEQELDLELPLARELLRLLSAAIPLAEKAKTAAPTVAIGREEPAA